MIVGDALIAPLSDAEANKDIGEDIFSSREHGHCILCHAIDTLDAPFQGNVGPALTDAGSRLSEGQIRLRIADYQRVKAGAVMPSYYRIHSLHQVDKPFQGQPALSADDIEHLVAYVKSLKASP